MAHGGVMIVTLIEGLYVNRVPVRILHIPVTIVVGLMYSLWSVFHGFYIQHNPYYDDDYGYIYPVLNWKGDAETALIVVSITNLVLMPLLNILVWSISLVGRRYQEGESTPDAEAGNKGYGSLP